MILSWSSCLCRFCIPACDDECTHFRCANVHTLTRACAHTHPRFAVVFAVLTSSLGVVAEAMEGNSPYLETKPFTQEHGESQWGGVGRNDPMLRRLYGHSSYGGDDGSGSTGHVVSGPIILSLLAMYQPCPNLHLHHSTGGPCDTDNIANAAAYADYSSCYNMTTGQQCTPTCITGSHVAHAASPITLNCDSNGDFDGTNTLVCVENQCAFPYEQTNHMMRITGDPSNGDPCDLSIADLQKPTYHGVLAVDIAITDGSDSTTTSSISAGIYSNVMHVTVADGVYFIDGTQTPVIATSVIILSETNIG